MLRLDRRDSRQGRDNRKTDTFELPPIIACGSCYARGAPDFSEAFLTGGSSIPHRKACYGRGTPAPSSFSEAFLPGGVLYTLYLTQQPLAKKKK